MLLYKAQIQTAQAIAPELELTDSEMDCIQGGAQLKLSSSASRHDVVPVEDFSLNFEEIKYSYGSNGNHQK